MDMSRAEPQMGNVFSAQHGLIQRDTICVILGVQICDHNIQE